MQAVPDAVRNYRGKRSGSSQYVPSDAKVTAAGGSSANPLSVDPSADNAIRPLVLLIDFDDRPAPANVASRAAFDALFFGSGPSDLSVRNYWAEVSYGNFAVNGSAADINPWTSTPTGWLRAGTDFSTTIADSSQIAGVNVTNIRQLLANAIAHLAAQPLADFSPYVRASDNTFHAVILVHPGYGAEETDDLLRDPYSHTAGITPPISTLQGSIVDYTIVPSVQFYNDPTPDTPPNPPLDNTWSGTGDDLRIGIGVIVHEMGHLLGLPDLYPTVSQAGQASDTFAGAGVYDLMSQGMWGNPALDRADVPAHLSAWSKAELGWLVPAVLSATTPGNLLPPAESGEGAFKVYPNGPGDESQFFLVENRQSGDPSSLFDKGLPGDGLLVWRVDNEKMESWRDASASPLSRPNRVNNDNVFLALSVQEADLSAGDPFPHLGLPPSAGGDFGSPGDFFAAGAPPFARTSPVEGQNRTNSSPTVDLSSTKHLFDAGFFLTFDAFSASGDSFDFRSELPYWKTFRSTDPPPTLGTNRVLSYGFDSSNRVWVGTEDQGVWIRSVGAWRRIDAFRSPRIQAMAFEPATGSMWVGTDRSIEKVRLDQVQAAFPAVLPSAIDVKAVRIARDLTKWLGGGRVLAVVTDDGSNQASGLAYFDLTSNILGAFRIDLGEQITAMALDNVFSSDRTLDILYVGTSRGRIYRNATPGGETVRSLYATNLNGITFEAMNLPAVISVPGSSTSPPAAIHAMEVDRLGILWVATDQGVFAFDRGDPDAVPPLPDLFNPFDLAGDNTVASLAYFPASFWSPTEPRGIAFQDTGQPNPAPAVTAREIVWVAYGDNNALTVSSSGGAERIDPNVLLNAAIPRTDAAARLGHATMRFRQDPLFPEKGPPVNDLIAAAGDGASNVWFGTFSSGAVRFGSGTSLTLDRTVYINDTAVAQVSLVDENSSTSTLIVRVTSSVDGAGFDLALAQGIDGVYRGSFGFSTGATDNVANRIAVSNGSAVTVTYEDTNPPATRTATATWKKVFPFEDSLFIEDFACFVATAAYGSRLAPEVRTLRAFRDAFLRTHGPGRAVVALYYRLSPPVAAAVARSPILRAASRFLLVPVLAGARLSLEASRLDGLVLAAVLLAGPVLLAATRRRRTKRAA